MGGGLSPFFREDKYFLLLLSRMGCTFSLPLRCLCLTWRSSSSSQLARAEDSSELPSEPHEYAVRRPSHTPYAVTLWFWGNTFLMTFSQIIRTYWKVGVRLQEGNRLSNRNLQLWDIRQRRTRFIHLFSSLGSKISEIVHKSLIAKLSLSSS